MSWGWPVGSLRLCFLRGWGCLCLVGPGRELGTRCSGRGAGWQCGPQCVLTTIAGPDPKTAGQHGLSCNRARKEARGGGGAHQRPLGTVTRAEPLPTEHRTLQLHPATVRAAEGQVAGWGSGPVPGSLVPVLSLMTPKPLLAGRGR